MESTSNQGTLESELQEEKEYFYETHSCPTNWIGEAVCIIEDGDTDPHGFLEFVRATFVSKEAEPDNPDALFKIFPEVFTGEDNHGKVIDGALGPTEIEVSTIVGAMTSATNEGS